MQLFIALVIQGHTFGFHLRFLSANQVKISKRIDSQKHMAKTELLKRNCVKRKFEPEKYEETESNIRVLRKCYRTFGENS